MSHDFDSYRYDSRAEQDAERIRDLEEDSRTLRTMMQDGFEVYDNELGIERRVHFVTDKGDPSVGIQESAYWILDEVGRNEMP